MLLLYLFLSPAFWGVLAQSRGPELKIPVPLKQAREKVSKDTTGYEERPYFLLIDQSEQALKDDKYAEAALRLVEAMAVEPNNPLNPAVMSNLGMIYFYNGQDSLALVTLDKVVERLPGLVAGHENRARVLTAMGRDDEAYKEYERVIEIDSVNTNARFYHGMMALYTGDVGTARADFDVINTVVPSTRVNYLAQGTLNSMTGNPVDGAYYFRKLIEVDPSVEYYASLAGCYLAANNLGDAAETLTKAIEKYPDDPELYYYRAWLKRDRYELDEAHRDAKRAIELGANPQRVAALFHK